MKGSYHLPIHKYRCRQKYKYTNTNTETNTNTQIQIQTQIQIHKVVVEKVLNEKLEHLVVKLEGELLIHKYKYKYTQKYKYTKSWKRKSMRNTL